MTDILNKQLVGYLPQIRRVVKRIAKDEGVVDDITQECCVRIIEKEKLWKNQNKLSQWINALTRNVTIDYLRRHWKQQKTVSTEEEIIEAPKDKDFSIEDIRWVISQFQYLTPMQKKVMNLKYFEGMKSVDIARKLNVTKATVSQHSSQALKTLKKKARTKGLLGILLPWNWPSLKLWPTGWNLREVFEELFIMNKTKTITIGVVSTLIGSVGTGMVYSNKLHEMEIEKGILKNQLALSEKDRLSQIDGLKKKADLKIASIESQLAALKNKHQVQINELNNKVDLKETIPEIKKTILANNNHRAGILEALNPEFIKSMAPFFVSKKMSDLEKELDLEPGEAAELKKHLIAKFKEEAEITGPFFDLIRDQKFMATVQESIENMDKYDVVEVISQPSMQKLLLSVSQMNLKTKIAQDEFDAHMASLLSQEKIDRFRQYETEKYQQKIIKDATAKVSKIKMHVQNISAQQEQKMIEAIAKSKSKDVPLGVNDLTMPLIESLKVMYKFNENLSADKEFEKMLDSDQLEQYQKYKSISLKNELNLFQQLSSKEKK